MTMKKTDPALDDFPGRVPGAGAEPADHEHARVVARPDGYYWTTGDGRREAGPFLTAAEARMALLAGRGTDREPGSLAGAKSDVGDVEARAVDDREPEA
jgi:hypothetical protein